MHPLGYIPLATQQLLDVGCNTGDLLRHCGERLPGVRLHGVDVNAPAIAAGRERANGAYPGGDAHIVWHHRFSLEELRALLPPELSVEYGRSGALFVLPLTDVFRWPFHRARRYDHPIARTLARIAEWDFGVNYRAWSYGILVVMRKTGVLAGDQ